MLVKGSADMEDVFDMSAENLARLKEEAKMIDDSGLMRYIRIFSDLSVQIKTATQKRVLLDVALIKLCRPQMEKSQDTLLERIKFLEKEIEELKKRGVQVSPGHQAAYAGEEEETVKKAAELPRALNEDVKVAAANFNMLVQSATPMLKVVLKKARLSAGDGNTLQIVLPDEIGAEVVKKEEHIQEIRTLLSEQIGKEIEIDVRHLEEGRRFEDSYVDIQSMIHMELTVEEE